jgi:hypothetical protein
MMSSTAIAFAEDRRGDQQLGSFELAGLVEAVVGELQDRQRLGAQHLTQPRLDHDDARAVVIARGGEGAVAQLEQLA